MGERAQRRSIRQIQRAKSPAELKLPRRTTADILRSLLADLLKHERVEVGREEEARGRLRQNAPAAPGTCRCSGGPPVRGEAGGTGARMATERANQRKGSEEYGGSLEVQADAEQRRVGGRAPEVTVYLCFHVYAYFHSSIILLPSSSSSSVSKK